MVVLDVQKVEFKPPQVGEDYIIVDASMETATGDFGEAKVIKVALEPLDRTSDDNNIYNEGLWYSPNYTPSSKQGAVLTGFEEYFKEHPELESEWGEKPNFKDLTHWVGGILRVLSWEDKKRKVQVRGYVDEETIQKLQKELKERQEASKDANNNK